MIAGLFAIDQAGGMGWHGTIPWPHNKDDMLWFKNLTQGHIVAMGRRTWESPDMPSPLPGRLNVVFTNRFFDRDDIEQVKGDIPEALTSLKKSHRKKHIFVIGGADILLQSKPVLERIYVTRIPGEYLNDVRLNLGDFLEGWTLEKTVNLGSCNVEEYHNGTVSSSARTRTKPGQEQN